ncbi:MAG: hypothetical protein AB1742_13810 [bacterium]
MASGGYVCRECGLRFGRYYGECPSCGAPVSAGPFGAFGAPGKFFPASGPARAAAVIALAALAAGAFYYAFSGMPVPVEKGVVYVCRVCGREYDRRVGKEWVRRGKHPRGGVARKKGLCPMCGAEVVGVETGTKYYCGTCGRLIGKKTAVVNVARAQAHGYELKKDRTGQCEECERIEELLRSHPGWTRDAAKLVVRGQVAVGMTVGQAQAAWGEPLWVESGSGEEGEVVEKWAYGDRILNIPTGDRFFIVHGGKVVFYEDPEEQTATTGGVD